MEPNNHILLEGDQLSRVLNRLAYQLYEKYFEEQTIVLAGIDSRGYLLASKLAEIYQSISGAQPILCKIILDKVNPNIQSTRMELMHADSNLTGASIVVCDDVLYTGRTLAYATYPFLAFQPKALETLVLIQRSYARFPILPAYVGRHIASTLQEHVMVDLEEGNSVYLK